MTKTHWLRIFLIILILALIVIVIIVYENSLVSPLSQTTGLSPGGLTSEQLSARQVLLAEQRSELAQTVPLTPTEVTNRAALLKSQRQMSLQK